MASQAVTTTASESQGPGRDAVPSLNQRSARCSGVAAKKKRDLAGWRSPVKRIFSRGPRSRSPRDPL